ncbi:MAG: hypothetical protein JOZ24_02110, partial [Candidatus Eremiobacteraeota bacterium]|nr:hypothetical protein [Candidatus Eremiobacteraeota bacterium]
MRAESSSGRSSSPSPDAGAPVYPELTCAEHLAFVAVARGRADPDAVVDDALARMALLAVGDRAAGELPAELRVRLCRAGDFIAEPPGRQRTTQQDLAMLLGLEGRLVTASVRSVLRQPLQPVSRLAIVFAVAWIALTDPRTAGASARDLGDWSPSFALVCAVAAIVLLGAAALGAHSASSYGVRAADALWWRLAGIPPRTAEIATAAVGALGAALCTGVPALAVAAVLAAAAPARVGSLFLLTG